MKTVDGAFGEGGGQILRTSLSLASITGTPVEVINVRAGRRRPGLLKQHLCAVKAAATICDGAVEGAELHSERVVLRPNRIRPGVHRFAVGSAGSAALVLQTVLPPLMLAERRSTVVIEGGTHNPGAPPFEFLDGVFRPALEAMGSLVELRLERPGFFPAGGGRIVAEIAGAGATVERRPFERLHRGPLVEHRGVVLTSRLPEHVARREAATLRALLGPDLTVDVVEVDAMGPGNAVLVALTFEAASAVFVGFGERGKPAERVAAEAADQARAFIQADVPVDAFLADQLLLPLALGAGGVFRTVAPSQHTQTNLHVLRQLLPVDIGIEADGPGDPDRRGQRVGSGAERARPGRAGPDDRALVRVGPG